VKREAEEVLDPQLLDRLTKEEREKALMQLPATALPGQVRSLALLRPNRMPPCL
jgi:hypothetical protein